jgi:alkanesulfonate monooxygenase SsuD/methylene tetrahydromethanopterin reductase-like flavin-dependent oxidoreductase (luciferase family)
MSGGRFDLGLGTGWNEFEHVKLGLPFPDSSERWAMLEDALAYMTEAFSDGEGSHKGPFYDLDLDVRPKPVGLRLIVGGSGMKRTPRLAGTYADEHNFFVCPPEEAAMKIRNMRDAAGDRKVEATTMAVPLVGASDGDYRNRLESAAASEGTTPEELEKKYLDRGGLVGTPGQVEEQIAALEEAGVERIYIQWFDITDYDGLAAAVEVIQS